MPDFSARAQVSELMDDLSRPAEEFDQAYRELATTNRRLGGIRSPACTLERRAFVSRNGNDNRRHWRINRKSSCRDSSASDAWAISKLLRVQRRCRENSVVVLEADGGSRGKDSRSAREYGL